MTEYNQNYERELGWDDEIEKEGGDFIILPAGEYRFRVDKFTRGRFAGSDKMPACPRAELDITIFSPEHGETTIKESLLLHTKTEWKLSEFFNSIGQKKTGEKVKMNWGIVTGAQGTCELEINKYVDRSGNERENNRVKKFIEPTAVAPQQPQTAYQAPPAQQQPAQPQQTYQAPFPTQQPPQAGGFTPGSF